MKEDYVSFECAKLLKEKGFREWCLKCYGVAVLHNGVAISFDEECELKDEGRENEIEYVEGGVLYNCGCNNSDKDAKVWAAPTLWGTMKWLREVHNIIITIHPNSFDADCVYYKADIWFNREYVSSYDIEERERKVYEESVEDSLKYCLTNLI